MQPTGDSPDQPVRSALAVASTTSWISVSSSVRLSSPRRTGSVLLLVEHGRTRGLDEPAHVSPALDEFLAPILDIIPAQLFADALAREHGIAPAFRYIGKVVTRL